MAHNNPQKHTAQLETHRMTNKTHVQHFLNILYGVDSDKDFSNKC